MNTIITSKEAILSASKRIAATEGIDKINMRAVAAACNVAVGSVYNYFPSKADLILATVEDIWRGIFHSTGACNQFTDFPTAVEWVFASIQKGGNQYPCFFSGHPGGFEGEAKGTGYVVMTKYFEHMREGLMGILMKDKGIREGVFDDAFSKQHFIHFVFGNIISLLVRGEMDCHILLEVIKRILYDR